jgi:hypothetical protein
MSHVYRTRWIFSLALLCAMLSPRAAHAGIGGTEEEARFLPGLYYFHKGCDYYRRGDASAAIDMWQLAASWAVKDAQYDLGIAYFRGRGVAIDKPRGLAWLALAAERKDAEFERSLAAAWDDATAEDHARANEIWRGLRGKYGDATALVRAEHRYKNEIDNITGSRVGMPGHVQIWTNSSAGFIDVATYKASIQALADRNFGTLPTGTVDVGPLTSILDEPPPK